jgi:hypothetical protein
MSISKPSLPRGSTVRSVGGSKRQYTVKGIDVETVDLMRDAARFDGMKINAWISSRMRGAAEQSLNLCGVESGRSDVSTNEADTGRSFESLLEALADFRAYQAAADERLKKIENELHEITSSQRTILTKMLGDQL